MMSKKDIMLIADDLDINRDILKEMFKENFRILEAEDGQECIELVKEYGEQIKVVLLDILMPVMSGLEVLKYRSRDAEFSEIPVIIITVNDEIKNQMIAFQLGATDYITKPFIREIVIYRINNVLSSKRRVEEIVKEKEKFQVKAELDLMTGLYNKATVERLMQDRLAANDTWNALFVIDIDNFKQVNDSEGHLVGDHTIRIIADLISGHFRKTDLIGRIGGDEFAVFMIDLPSRDLARRKAEELIGLLRYKPNITIPANVTVSIGLAFTEKKPYSYQELFVKADKALYCAKKNGKGQYAEYGVEKSECFSGDEEVMLLFSRNREICQIIEDVTENIKLEGVFSIEEFCCLKKKYEQGICLVYIDISEEKDNGKYILEQIKKEKSLKDLPFFAICAEGNIEQYKIAIEANAKDIIPVPINLNFIRRRIKAFLNKRME